MDGSAELFVSTEQCSAKLCHYQALQVAVRTKDIRDYLD